VFDNKKGRVYFEAFDAATRHRIGVMDLNGFEQNARDEGARFHINSSASPIWNQGLLNRESFEYPFRNPGPPDVTFDGRSPVRGEQWVLHSGESVFLIDTIARSTRDLLPGHRVRSMAPVNRIVPIDRTPAQPAKGGAKPRWEYQIWLAVRTDDRIVLLNPEAGLREEYVFPPVWRNREISL